jgi:hypothetical protein
MRVIYTSFTWSKLEYLAKINIICIERQTTVNPPFPKNIVIISTYVKFENLQIVSSTEGIKVMS